MEVLILGLSLWLRALIRLSAPSPICEDANGEKANFINTCLNDYCLLPRDLAWEKVPEGMGALAAYPAEKPLFPPSVLLDHSQ